MADRTTWVKFTRDFTWHHDAASRQFSAGKSCPLSPEIVEAAVAAGAAERIKPPAQPASKAAAKPAPRRRPAKS